MDKVLWSSNKMDWETPQELFDKLNSKYNFTIDVASNEKKSQMSKILY